MYTNKDVMKRKQAPMSALPTIPVTASEMNQAQKIIDISDIRKIKLFSGPVVNLTKLKLNDFENSRTINANIS